MDKEILSKIEEAEKLFAGYEITGSELARVRELRERLTGRHMNVSVIGQFKRGKSALANRILGEEILPVGIVPVTAVVTSVEYGDRSAAVRFANGVVKQISPQEISGFVNEQKNRDNHLQVKRVDIKCPADFLKGGITFVDTPGVGSLHEKNSAEAYAFVKESDAVIFTLSVDSPINQIEIEFLRNAREYAAKFYFAVNKIDVIDEGELNDYLEYCRGFIAELMGTESVMLFPVSAKKGTGVEELKRAVLADLKSAGGEIMESSAYLKLHDIVVSALRQIKLYRAALSMTGDEFDEKFAAMRKTFDAIREKTAALPASMKENGAVREAYLNEVKNRLAEEVQELFGIDYHYDIGAVDGSVDGRGADGARADGAETDGAGTDGAGALSLEAEADEICRALDETLNTVFMHREENAYKVVRRINDLNRLVRKLVKLREDTAR